MLELVLVVVLEKDLELVKGLGKAKLLMNKRRNFLYQPPEARGNYPC